MTCFSDVKTEESKCSLKEVDPLISTLVPPGCPQSSGCTEVPQEFSSVSSSHSGYQTAWGRNHDSGEHFPSTALQSTQRKLK